MYFRFFSLHFWRKRSAVQPQAIYSEFPKKELVIPTKRSAWRDLRTEALYALHK